MSHPLPLSDTPAMSWRACALAACVLIAVTHQALAHAHLKSATPQPGGTVTGSPSELDLRFSEGLNLKFTSR